MTLAAVLAVLAASASAQVPSSGSVHIAVFRDSGYALSALIADPFERMLREDASRFRDIEVSNIAIEFNGDEYRYDIPEVLLRGVQLQEGYEEEWVEYLESEEGLFFFTPASKVQTDRFVALIEDPESYPERRLPRIKRKTARLMLTRTAKGGLRHTLVLPAASRVVYPEWKHSLAFAYRLGREGHGHYAVFIMKSRAGEGRVAAALERMRDRFGADLLVLNRGEVFTTGHAKTTGTAAGLRFERMGVRASVLGGGDVYRLRDVLQYRAERPDGMKFLSANLVYSTSPVRTVLPAYAVFQIQGLRVAVFGITRPNYAKVFRAEDVAVYDLLPVIPVAQAMVAQLRSSADILIALTNLSPSGNLELKHQVQGLDLILGDDLPFGPSRLQRTTLVTDDHRTGYGDALLISTDFTDMISRIEVTHRTQGPGEVSFGAREEHVFLDESVPDKAGHPKFNPVGFGVSTDTRPFVLPSLRKLYGSGIQEKGAARFSSRAFWKLAASLGADRAGAEAGLMPVSDVLQRTTGDYLEGLVREWFIHQDELVRFELMGGELAALVAEARRQEIPGASMPVDGRQIAFGGIAEGDKIHGAAIDPGSSYRIAGTRRLLALSDQYPSLKAVRHVESLGDLETIIMDILRKGVDDGWTVSRYRALLEGRPFEKKGIWKVHFRDINLNLSNTKVVRDDAFAAVPDARVQGFDELLIGSAFKADLEYFQAPHKWTNEAEVEYSKSRLRPPSGVVILNTPQNRTMFRSVETVRVGAFPWHWFARSFGPSLGLQYDGHVERLPLQRRAHIASVLPGIELFGGYFVRSFSLSANLRRDYTPRTPVNQYGARARALVSTQFGSVRLEGEIRGNYFFLTPQDTHQDLRLDLNSNFKLHVPVYKNFTLSPFMDVYYFMLKTRPLYGYSAIAGISLNFSRIWKPQYESLW